MTLGDRLSAARRRRFVGREGECALFESALTAPELPFYVLYLFGPGGVGKTTLMAEFARLGERHGTRVLSLDARNVEPAPEGFLNALRLGLGLAAPDNPLQHLAAQDGRRVLIIDTYETLLPLDTWLRDIFLPQLPDDTLIVLAGRRPPAPAWRADPGWQALVHVVPLRNLNPDESRAYLAKRAIPPEQHHAVLAFTHGHPLALALVADVCDQRQDADFQPETVPDVIKALLERFVQKVPGPAHRTALEACALVRLTTESLLAEMVGISDIHELFDWLRGLSFIEAGRQGLFPHDLAREALVADLRWRNPDWYGELHRRARGYYVARLQQARGHEQQRILLDYIFLHRENPFVRPFFEWQGQESSGLLADVLRDSDRPALRAMVAQHEGEDSARLADHWLARQPESVTVFRDTEQEPVGFLMAVGLQAASAADLDADPATAAAWRTLQGHAPLRPGECATLFRFWMEREQYQAVSPVQSLVFVNVVRHYLVTPGLVFTFFPCADADFWAPVLTYADLARLPAAEFEVGGRHYGVYGHNWRAVSPMAWLTLLADREVGLAAPEAPPAPSEPLVVLSQPDFFAAVRDALRDFAQPEQLRDNPLLRSRLVVEHASGTPATAGTASAPARPAERIGALVQLIQNAAEELKATPRAAKTYRALYHTYLKPAATQEQAAELLDLPFSTYRRHLKAALTRVSETLWRWELQGTEG